MHCTFAPLMVALVLASGSTVTPPLPAEVARLDAAREVAQRVVYQAAEGNIR